MRRCRPIRTSRTTSSSTNTYDGDNGRGLGASHQTGWSALVANMIAELHE